MQYKDPEYYIYRCFSADSAEGVEEEFYFEDNSDKFYYIYIDGDVAWSCNECFKNIEDTGKISEVNNTGAHYITLDLLCKKLDIGIECYGQESGIGFQEYYHVNHNGDIIADECEDWTCNWLDENGEELEEAEEEGGIEGYGCFTDSEYIYKGGR